MRAFLAGARIQSRFLRAYPDSLIPFFTAPMFTVIFLMIFRQAGRPDLTAYATVAPVFIALWWLALFNAGWSIQIERWNGTIEMLVAAPSSFAAVILGRITTTTMIGVVSFGEAWLVARLIFGATVRIHHLWAFAATIVITLAAMAGTSVAMSSLFVLTRNAVTFSNAASYPFYILGGILVPVSVLPHWIRPVSSIVFLSWSADLLRAALRSTPARCPVPARHGRAARRLRLHPRSLGNARNPRASAGERRAGNDVRSLVSTLRVVWYALVSGANDYWAIWSAKSWLFGLQLRIFSQVSFFALIGKLLRSDEQAHFFLVGNAVMVAAMGATFAMNMTTAERANGTLSLLLAAPRSRSWSSPRAGSTSLQTDPQGTARALHRRPSLRLAPSLAAHSLCGAADAARRHLRLLLQHVSRGRDHPPARDHRPGRQRDDRDAHGALRRQRPRVLLSDLARVDLALLADHERARSHPRRDRRRLVVVGCSSHRRRAARGGPLAYARTRHLRQIHASGPAGRLARICIVNIVAIDDGYDFKVLVVDDTWVLRFPRRQEVVSALETEIALLPALAEVLPVEVPRFEHVSREPPFVAYRLIRGTPLVDEDAEGVRAFLEALHSQDVSTLPVQPVNWVESYRAKCGAFEELVFPVLDDARRRDARALFDEVDSLTEFDPVLVHSDLGSEHMLVRDGRLAGVIDWGDAQLGDPALDYSWLLQGPFPGWDVDPELRRRARFYYRLAPFYSVHYGVFRGQPDYVDRALETLRSRL